MKKSGVCPKCGNKKVEGPFQQGNAIMIGDKYGKWSTIKGAYKEAYVCLQGSYIEEYIAEKDLPKARKWRE